MQLPFADENQERQDTNIASGQARRLNSSHLKEPSRFLTDFGYSPAGDSARYFFHSLALPTVPWPRVSRLIGIST